MVPTGGTRCTNVRGVDVEGRRPTAAQRGAGPTGHRTLFGPTRRNGGMHFDPREQAALREVGLTTEELQAASEAVADAVETTATDLETFFDEHEVVYSTMDQAHSAAEYPEHEVRWLDTYTHAADLRGWLRFDTWGVPVEDGRALSDDTVELTLGATVNGRVRFAPTREALE